ncbi:hypothetical protein AB9F47_19510 [Rhizobium leguminosarum]|uniref:HD domain-containing protein n=1 Tax=Rhizobium leguminosarum TaxID=384 RepID=UPI003F97E2A4
MIRDWKDTRLWSRIKDTEAAATLQECMNQIQAVLQHGSTMPVDFTLHDSDHSFRVAERTADLLPEDPTIRLGTYDIAQLLLASYLHDIGMSPNRALSEAHRFFITTGDPSKLSDIECTELQQWLDEYWQGLVPPVAPNELGEFGISKAEEIHAYYCRYKHNDWSERWIRENLVDLRSPLYHGWVDDLITLCRSHHESLHDLRTDRFDLRVVGSNGECLNLRYLAALLRLADVLEFDPERTPEVIMRHRDIAPKSKIYWRKDHSISFSVVQAEHALFLAARTPDAAVHRAVIDTIECVNNELNTCATLQYEGLFQKGTAPLATKNRYSWPWPSQLRSDIRERDDSFVYIDGGFRPDKVKILELLSGTHLYGDRWAAVRELLQNAVDAVREQIARERLLKDAPDDPKWEAILGEAHRIRITLETDGIHYFLTCADDGVGMDRKIIENHLLVSGAGPRGDLTALERNSKKHGFSVGRTGQFGIGLLSYFMLADSISIYTRRSSQAGDVDSTGWRFSIEGLNSFGELRAESRGAAGTTVRLRLKKNVVEGKPDEFTSKLILYVGKMLRYSPCPISFIDQISGHKVHFPLGWTASETDVKKAVAPDPPLGFGNRAIKKGDYRPFEEQEAIRKEQEDWANVISRSAEKLSLFGPVETRVPDVDGLARGWVAFEELEGGASLAFLDLEDGKVNRLSQNLDFVPLAGNVGMAWRGFAVNSRAKTVKNVILELNCTTNGNISVDRRGLQSEFDFQAHSVDLKRKILTDFLNAHSNSEYALLNCYVAREAVPQPALTCRWMASWAMQQPGERRFMPIVFPCADILVPRYSGELQHHSAELGGTVYNLLAHLLEEKYSIVKISNILHSGKLAFTRWNDSYFVPSFTWDSEDELRGVGTRPFTSVFPKGWETVAMILTRERVAFNANHEVVKAEESVELLVPLRPLEELVESLKVSQSRSTYREIVLLNLRRNSRFWNGFRDNFPDEFMRLIKGAELPGGEIRAWHFYGSFEDSETMILSERGAEVQVEASSPGNVLRFADGVAISFLSRALTIVD